MLAVEAECAVGWSWGVRLLRELVFRLSEIILIFFQSVALVLFSLALLKGSVVLISR